MAVILMVETNKLTPCKADTLRHVISPKFQNVLNVLYIVNGTVIVHINKSDDAKLMMK
uniref:Uncharacterized protein n=1 Tax=Romanomermis culicivorax TaxID=13658 RepID=A0A915J0V6_ROMCU